MSKTLTTIVVVVAAVTILLCCVLAIFIVAPYNSLVGQRNEVDGQWSQVENVMQRRADLVPQLVETVRGSAIHEQKIFDELTSAREALANASTPTEANEALAGMNAVLGRLLVLVEDNPELQANQAFRDLMVQLEGTQNRVTTEIRNYNKTVVVYRNTRQAFPTNIVAGMFGFGPKPLFEADEEALENPEVHFDFGE